MTERNNVTGSIRPKPHPQPQPIDTKIDLRRAIKERLMNLSANDRRVESQVIVRELKKLIGDKPKTIGVYLPFTDEPDIKPLIEELLGSKWNIAIPSAKAGKLQFRTIESLADVSRDPLTGIPEPAETLPLTKESSIAIVLVPGRAFTAGGMRLGRGNGGYDIWIGHQREANPETKYIAVCFECQIMHEVPMEAHDQKVDLVVTASKIYT